VSTPKVDIGPFVVGERPAPLVYQFRDSNNAALNIAGYTAKFAYKEYDGPSTTKNATVSSGANGEVTYAWDGTEFAGPGHYQAELWVGNLTQKFASIRIEFDVRVNIAVPVPNI
jgi:hypothetical protein